MRAAKIASDKSIEDMIKRLGPDFKLRTCGIGVVDNKGTPSKGVLCADVNYVEPDKCVEAYGSSLEFPPPEGMVCLKFSALDSNACSGDFGGLRNLFSMFLELSTCSSGRNRRQHD